MVIADVVHYRGNDSTMGKMMEKAGGMMHNAKLEQKGIEKREEAGGFSGTSGSNNNY